MLEKVKLALRLKTAAFDAEIQDLIDAALADLKLAGIIKEDQEDPPYYPRSSYLLPGKLWQS